MGNPIIDAREMRGASRSGVYEYPNSRFCAGFIGSTNLFDRTVVEDEPDCIVVESEELESGLYISHGITGQIGVVAANRVMLARERRLTRDMQMAERQADPLSPPLSRSTSAQRGGKTGRRRTI